MAQKKQVEYIKQSASNIDVLTTHNKILEAQIAEQASSSPTPPGRISSKPKPNPEEHCNCAILRSEVDGSKGVRIEEDGELNHDESERSKMSKLPSLTQMPPLPFTFPPKCC